VPKPDGWFDFAITEYGAAIWADPYRWVPEAHRLLKAGGELVMLGHHPLTLCVSVPNQDVPLAHRRDALLRHRRVGQRLRERAGVEAPQAGALSRHA